MELSSGKFFFPVLVRLAFRVGGPLRAAGCPLGSGLADVVGARSSRAGEPRVQPSPG